MEKQQRDWQDQDYKLVWSEEFDYNGRPDSDKWHFEVGNHQWPNNERQAYTDRPENVCVKDGKLYITARKEQDGERAYTSAKITTWGKSSWTYGRIVISAKLPTGAGSWPAIWMMPDDARNGIRWPLCGEIDIMEHTGMREGKIFFSLHSQNHNHIDGTDYTTNIAIPGICEGFHEYAIEWTPDSIAYYVDGKFYVKYAVTDDTADQSEKSWPFRKPYYLILNIAVGGGLGGPVDDATLPYTMEVDYIRVYQKNNEC